ncbi:MAG: hypothetical protein QXK37_00850 [Candidatus Woesearchaeota archaeon]
MARSLGLTYVLGVISVVACIASVIVCVASSVVASDEITVQLPETYRAVRVGQNIWFTSEVPSEMIGRRVYATYEILDKDRQLIASKNESFILDTEKFVGSIMAPERIIDGLYYLSVSVKTSMHNGGQSETTLKAEAVFSVENISSQAQQTIENSLFDIIIDIPQSYREINPGGQLLASIKLINVGSKGRVDVFLDYWIADSAKNLVFKKRETVAVETQANFVKIIDIPKTAKPGTYHFNAKITYANGLEAESEYLFTVTGKKARSLATAAFIVAGIIVSILLVTALRFVPFKSIIEKTMLKKKVRRIVKQKLNSEK